MRSQSKTHEANKNVALLYDKAELRKLNILKYNKIFNLKLCLLCPILLRLNWHTVIYVNLKGAI